MRQSDVLLEVKNLRVGYKVYEGNLRVLDGLSFHVRKGERVGLIGETGCGKTTTLRTIMGILPRAAFVDEGEVVFRGKNVLNAPTQLLYEFRRHGASMVFQDPTAALNPVFTVGQLMDEVIKYSVDPKTSPSERRSMAVDSLMGVSLPDPERILQSYPFQLSGGMRQRICIAMAVGVNREILLADEPGTSLDVTIQDQILRLINSLVESKGLSVVMVTHSLGVIRETTDRVYVMYAGNVVESAPVRELFSSPSHPYTMALLECIPKLSGQRLSHGIPGSMPNYLRPPTGCRFNPRCPKATERCRVEKPPINLLSDEHEVACFLYNS